MNDVEVWIWTRFRNEYEPGSGMNMNQAQGWIWSRFEDKHKPKSIMFKNESSDGDSSTYGQIKTFESFFEGTNPVEQVDLQIRLNVKRGMQVNLLQEYLGIIPGTISFFHFSFIHSSCDSWDLHLIVIRWYRNDEWLNTLLFIPSHYSWIQTRSTGYQTHW